jgi:ribosome biogenesis GTPase
MAKPAVRDYKTTSETGGPREDTPVSPRDQTRVVTVSGKRCRVNLPDGSRVEAVVRGRIFDEDRRNAVVVGDIVSVSEAGGQWTVDSVLPRRNEFIRQGLSGGRQVLFSNVDRVLILAALLNPTTKAASIDRFLVAALQCGIPPVLVLTKSDLDEGRRRQHEIAALYEGFDLPVYAVSNLTGAGIKALESQIAEGISGIVGNSGVGKSALLNRLVPGLDLAVREVSSWSGKGTNTTSAALMIPYGDGAALIDTAGMKSFVPFGLTYANLQGLFPDIAVLSQDCRFTDCRHGAEPGCAVSHAVEQGRLPASRLRSYRRMYEEIPDPYEN